MKPGDDAMDQGVMMERAAEQFAQEHDPEDPWGRKAHDATWAEGYRAGRAAAIFEVADALRWGHRVASGWVERHFVEGPRRHLGRDGADGSSPSSSNSGPSAGEHASSVLDTDTEPV